MHFSRFGVAVLAGVALQGASRASDTPTAFLARAAQYEQTSAAAPKLLTSLPYLFIAEGESIPRDAADVMSAALPTTGVIDIEARNNGDNSSTNSFNFKIQYTSLASFNSAFPAGPTAGSYSLTFFGNSDQPLKLPLAIKSVAFPNVPTVTNYAACQKIDATKAFAVTWGAFTGATGNDRVLFGVQGKDDGYEFISNGSPAGPVSAADGRLAGTAKSFSIPAGSLPPGTDLSVQLVFVRADVQSSLQGQVTGFYASGAGSLTQLIIHTAGTRDTVKPTVKSSTPANNATGIATTATMTITFSEAMRTRGGWSINFNNLGNSQPGIAWKDAKTLTLSAPSGGWPKGKKIGVILNPPTWTPYLQDLSGNPLAASTISFTVKS